MKDKRVIFLRVIGIVTLAMGFIGLAAGAGTSSAACFCGAGSVINASNIIAKKNRDR